MSEINDGGTAFPIGRIEKDNEIAIIRLKIRCLELELDKARELLEEAATKLEGENYTLLPVEIRDFLGQNYTFFPREVRAFLGEEKKP